MRETKWRVQTIIPPPYIRYCALHQSYLGNFVGNSNVTLVMLDGFGVVYHPKTHFIRWLRKKSYTES